MVIDCSLLVVIAHLIKIQFSSKPHIIKTHPPASCTTDTLFILLHGSILCFNSSGRFASLGNYHSGFAFLLVWSWSMPSLSNELIQPTEICSKETRSWIILDLFPNSFYSRNLCLYLMF